MLNKKYRVAIAALTTGGLIAVSSLALADTTQTVFYVSSNGLNGHVNYDIHLNSSCVPTGNSPVYAYYKNADGSTRSLNSQEQQGYRISHQSASGNTTEITLGAFEHYGIQRPISITSSRLANGNCQTRAFTIIDGNRAQLAYAHVEVNRRQVLGQTVGVRLIAMSLMGANQHQETFACQANCEYGL